MDVLGSLPGALRLDGGETACRRLPGVGSGRDTDAFTPITFRFYRHNPSPTPQNPGHAGMSPGGSGLGEGGMAAHLLGGAAARVGDGEGHLARRDLGLTLLHVVPVGDDQVAGRVAQRLQVAPAHVGLHPVRQAEQLWGRGRPSQCAPQTHQGLPPPLPCEHDRRADKGGPH